MDQRVALHNARQQLLWSLKLWTDYGSPFGTTMTRQALEGIIELLWPPLTDWEVKAIADTEEAIVELERQYEQNFARDTRIIPH